MANEPHFDGCEVVEKLRSGPATDWYLGKQRSLGRAVVIKALSPHVLPESPFAGPLAREAKLLSRLQHQNVVQLYEFAERPQSMWLVLEHVDGVSLVTLLEQRQGKGLGAPAALAIMLQLVRTLAYIHERGIVHRDVQPKNIWVSRDGIVKLSNFFMAAEESTPAPPELLEADSGFESPSYMSPEQLLNEAPDSRSDLFSAGVILYELITGHKPFDASDSRTTTQRIRHEAPPAVSRFAPDTPPSVERVILRALQKLPADRFQSADEMSLMLGAAWDELGFKSTREAIVDELARAGVVQQGATTTPRPLPERRQTSQLQRAGLVYGACLAFMVGGGFTIRHFSEDRAQVRPTRQGVLELAPDRAGYLKCIVRPWAHVVVDGQRVATTPFASPIPLRPGTHYVRFEHPKTQPEQRTLNIAAGQHILLEVEMPLPSAPPVDEAELVGAPPDAGDPSP